MSVYRDKSVLENTSDGVFTWKVANLFTPCSGVKMHNGYRQWLLLAACYLCSYMC